MWRFHAVQHSPEHLDWVSGFRVRPFDGVLIAPGFSFPIGVGCEDGSPSCSRYEADRSLGPADIECRVAD